jgi:3-deoxy-7-phosphoheptulonate synthase
LRWSAINQAGSGLIIPSRRPLSKQCGKRFRIVSVCAIGAEIAQDELGFFVIHCGVVSRLFQCEEYFSVRWRNRYFPASKLVSCLAGLLSATICGVTRHRTDDLRITGLNPLISPAVLAYYLPLTERASELVASTRAQAEAILRREDDRLLAIVGPCSIHDPEAAMEYAEKLKAEAKRIEKDVLVIMRVYFEKPRTTVGWKGLINDPHLDDSFDINHGLRVARGLLLDLANMGVPSGTEFLDTISPQYIADLIAWGAIGARTTESQIHRELASGLSMPVGFKNGTGGSIQIALDAIQSSSRPHHFLSVTKQGVSAIVSTAGNESCHLILRGGKSGPNYEKPEIDAAVAMLREQNLTESVMVDCSHGNSMKDFRNQPMVAQNLANQIAAGAKEITSVMIESNLVEGNQKLAKDLSALTRGQSVTDACIGWSDTVETLDKLAEAVRQRRAQ